MNIFINKFCPTKNKQIVSIKNLFFLVTSTFKKLHGDEIEGNILNFFCIFLLLFLFYYFMHSFIFIFLLVSSTTIHQDLTTTFLIPSSISTSSFLGFNFSFRCCIPHAKQFRVLQWFLPQFAEPLWGWLISLSFYATSKKISFFIDPSR
jgi:hypothetical protein